MSDFVGKSAVSVAYGLHIRLFVAHICPYFFKKNAQLAVELCVAAKSICDGATPRYGIFLSPTFQKNF
jgi:hypothetical protein